MKKEKILEAAKQYWLHHFPLEEMPDTASVISESYRNKMITENQAMSAMRMVEGDIDKWIKENNILYKTIKSK